MTHSSARRAAFAALALIAAPLAAAAHDAERQVSVQGEGVVMRAPDRAAVTLGVEETRETAVEAINAASSGAEGVIAALRQVGVPETDIATVDISLGPVYRHERAQDGSSSSQVIAGYRAANVLRVTVRELGKLGEAIGAATSAGGNTVSSISFEISDHEKALAEARAAAVADARARADTLATAAGATLGEVLSISEMNHGGGPVMRMQMAAADAAPPPFMAGTRAISVTVTASWALAD